MSNDTFRIAKDCKCDICGNTSQRMLALKIPTDSEQGAFQICGMCLMVGSKVLEAAKRQLSHQEAQEALSAMALGA